MSSERRSPFEEIFAEDDTFGLLATETPRAARSTEAEIVVSQFEAINVFVDQHGVLPGTTEGGREPGLNEYALEAQLETFRTSAAYHGLLAYHDRHALLGPMPADLPTTMSEILASDDTLLDADAEHIFALRHVREAPATKAVPDDIARRRPCEHFERFAPIFAELKADLASGKRITKRFEREGSIVPGASFILNGIIAYVAAVDDLQPRGKEHDGRISVIFDNGTESNHLFRSFARVLYEDDNGRQIIETAPTVNGPLFGGEGHVSGPLFTGEAPQGEFGTIQGTVYIVESLSKDPQIAELQGRLYKVGFTTQPIAKRLANVEKEATFLYAPVHLLRTFDTNFDPQKLEQLLHQFFGNARLQVDISLGKTVSPKEWFVVPHVLVEEAVTRILDRSILNYRYDQISRKIVPR